MTQLDAPRGHNGSRMTEPSRGAYGLRLGPPLAEEELVDAPTSWPQWRMCWQETALERRQTQRIGPDEALLDLTPKGQVLVDRLTSTSTFLLPAPPQPEAWSHPYLSSTALLVAWWSGRRSFHAGAFVAGGGAWAVLGDKEQGKSSILAWLARRGYPVLCDDVLVIDQGQALSGPRCLDLREGASAHFGMGTWIGLVGARERWRVHLPETSPQVPFRGWVAPAWADEVSVGPVKVADRLKRILPHRGLTIPEKDDGKWLDLIARPMLELRRPKSWSSLDLAMSRLLEALPGL